MKITWFGTASLLLEYENNRILIDPYLTPRGAENPTFLLDYTDVDSILITHGHLDHLASVPKIMDYSDATVYCSALPAATLEKKKADSDQIAIVQPGNILHFGEIKVTVLPGKHISFDSKLIQKTLCSPRILRYLPNTVLLAAQNLCYREGNETLAYLIEAGGKTILVLGSLNLDDNFVYPKNVDLLILPYQGASDLITPALSILDRIEPKNVMLDHFDDAFPPASQHIDTKPLKKVLAKQYPDLPVVKPTAGKPVTLL